MAKVPDERGNMRKGTKEYLISWKGYDEPTWEPEECLGRAWTREMRETGGIECGPAVV